MTQQQQNWDRFRNRWVCDGVIYEIDTLYLRGSSIFRPINGDDLGDNVEMKTKWGFFIQSTGLKDKNGKLIYEGDIVEGNGKTWEIRWKNCCLGFVDVKCKYQAHRELRADTEGTDYVILGNIHTNPELLTALKTGGGNPPVKFT